MDDRDRMWFIVLLLVSLAYLLNAPPTPDFDLYVPHF